ncbi:MAG: ATP-binding protein, partial [Candidatus Omnitrophica bacterium]|nr:ATP-binding protein [Candidatus Omnitrophota bacterium]
MTNNDIKKTFTIKSDLKAMHPAVDEILHFLKERNVSHEIQHDVKLAADEAIINAIKHGNKFNEALPVVVDLECSAKMIRISVEDKGKGYDRSKVPDPTSEENIERGHGRGVYLIKKIMD